MGTEWLGALVWVLWVLVLVLALWVVLRRLDKKLKKDQHRREAKACEQAGQAIEQWRLRQEEARLSAETKTQ